ncbi:MAG: AI-2E family transporter [Planctomycetota bacterium]
MDRKVFMSILLSVVVVGLIVLTFSIFRPFLLSMLWAAALAIVSYGTYEKLRAKLGGRKTPAAAAMSALVFLVVLGPVLLLVAIFVRDAVALLGDATSANVDATLRQIEENSLARKALGWAERIAGEPVDLRATLNSLRELVEPLVAAKVAQDVGTFLLGLLANLFFILLSIFYFYRDGPAAVRALRELLPLHDVDRDAILADVRAAIVASVRGGLVTAIAQGFLGFIILFILAVPQPVLWSSAMAVASLVPLVGTAVVWVPMAGLFAIRGEMEKGLVLAGYGLLVIGTADNFLRPLLVGRHMEAHPLQLFFGILGGIALFGFAGIILGPVCVAFLTVAMRIFRREFRAAAAPTS